MPTIHVGRFLLDFQFDLYDSYSTHPRDRFARFFKAYLQLTIVVLQRSENDLKVVFREVIKVHVVPPMLGTFGVLPPDIFWLSPDTV